MPITPEASSSDMSEKKSSIISLECTGSTLAPKSPESVPVTIFDNEGKISVGCPALNKRTGACGLEPNQVLCIRLFPVSAGSIQAPIFSTAERPATIGEIVLPPKLAKIYSLLSANRDKIVNHNTFFENNPSTSLAALYTNIKRINQHLDDAGRPRITCFRGIGYMLPG